MSNKIKCRNCEYLKSDFPRNGGTRYKFICNHKNQRYIHEYFTAHKMIKTPAFICFGGGLYGDEPTIKRSPAWCPLKKESEE